MPLSSEREAYLRSWARINNKRKSFELPPVFRPDTASRSHVDLYSSPEIATAKDRLKKLASSRQLCSPQGSGSDSLTRYSTERSLHQTTAKKQEGQPSLRHAKSVMSRPEPIPLAKNKFACVQELESEESPATALQASPLKPILHDLVPY